MEPNASAHQGRSWVLAAAVVIVPFNHIALAMYGQLVPVLMALLAGLGLLLLNIVSANLAGVFSMAVAGPAFRASTAQPLETTHALGAAPNIPFHFLGPAASLVACASAAFLQRQFILSNVILVTCLKEETGLCALAMIQEYLPWVLLCSEAQRVFHVASHMQRKTGSFLQKAGPISQMATGYNFRDAAVLVIVWGSIGAPLGVMAFCALLAMLAMHAAVKLTSAASATYLEA